MIVFVHGVPETGAIWDRVRAELTAESTAVELPGFGVERPEGFGATKDDYADWLIAELERIVAASGPVHLVGHDWGTGLVARVVSSRPELVASWVVDVANILHPDYVWHGVAQIWQAPEQGEGLMEAMGAQPVEDQAQGLTGIGLAIEDARDLAGWSTPTMRDSILRLYRSAVPNIHAGWGPWSTTPPSGLVLHATDDPFSDQALAIEVAHALGAEVGVLEGVGHFWPRQDPAQGAEVLHRFWSTLSHAG